MIGSSIHGGGGSNSSGDDSSSSMCIVVITIISSSSNSSRLAVGQIVQGSPGVKQLSMSLTTHPILCRG